MMKHIPLSAKVECSDGECGESTRVVADPITRRLTYLVVQEQRANQRERLVPVELVVRTSSNLIQLDCSTDELAAMEPFSSQQFMELEATASSETSFVLPYAILEASL